MFEVGQKVRVKRNLSHIPNEVFVTYGMTLYEGEIACILEKWSSTYGSTRYNIDLDERNYVWEDCLLEPVDLEELKNFIKEFIIFR